MRRGVGAVARRLPGIGRLLRDRDRLRADLRRLRRQQGRLEGEIAALRARLTEARLHPTADASRRICPACGSDVPWFEPGPDGRPDARCPRCQALERHRMLLWILRRHELLFVPPARVLDVAPTPSVRNYLAPRLGSRYVTTDLAMEGVAVRADLARLCFADAAFDVVICYHVLEHVPDDRAAIRELARVLKPGGIAFLQVPRSPDAATDEDPAAPAEERIKRFGQQDHVRLYGRDLEDRLTAGGLRARAERPGALLGEDDLVRFGLRAAEELWICRR